MPSEKDKATIAGNMYRKFSEVRTFVSRNMGADRQANRQTDRQAHHNIPLLYQGRDLIATYSMHR